MEARKYADLAMIEGHGYEPLPLDNLKYHIHEFDIIFNTIPSLILNDEILTKVKKDALIIDLASKPGGIDFDAAKQEAKILRMPNRDEIDLEVEEHLIVEYYSK